MSKNIRLSVPGMKCSGCVAAIEKALKNDLGITKLDTDLEAKTVLVETDISYSALSDSIKTAGYDAFEITVVGQET